MVVSEPFIRSIEEGDFKRVAELINKNFPHMRMTPSKLAWRLSPNYSYFVAVVNGEVAGFADIKLREKTAKLMGMAVEEKFRGRGVGSSLIRKAIEFSTEKGKRMVYLNVRRGNLAAIHFYQKNGFILKKEVENDDDSFYILYRKLET
ncbi:GNAT family N-acetyltransferase [Candidatus Micrarchaeota archaeon]|nr:GNAT family N-acetyltransferase [Candidatus Micrarchaeota archaeon]